jgi:tRNA(Arg) A34 adenosine deaminase TadA
MSDEELLRHAFVLAHRARANGNPPFGAILVDAGGLVVLEAENTSASARDCTGHAETNLLREASRRFGDLGVYTMYASGEPCCMCTGAAFWGGLGRIVFGLSAARLHALRGDTGTPMLSLTCREVVSRGPKDIAVIGPLLEDEAAAVFLGG